MTNDSALVAPRPLNEVETLNVEVVRAFMAAAGKLDPDERYGRYCAPQSRIRWESAADSPVQWDPSKTIVGPEAAAAGSKKYVQAGLIYEPIIHEIYASGPVVVTRRTDVRKIPGQADYCASAVGVFVVKNGKIEEWTDYLG